MGPTNIGFELITDVRTFAGNKLHDVKAEDFLSEWVAEHPTFRARKAVAHFRAHHRTDGPA